MKKFAFALLTLTAICHAQTGNAVDASRDFVISGDEAVGILPPKVVCEYAPTSVSWSPDGRYIFLIRTDPKITATAIKQLLVAQGTPPPVAEKSVVIVDVAKGTSQTVWKTEERDLSIGEIAWLPGTSLAFVTIGASKVDPETKEMSTTYRIVATNAQNGKMQTVAEGTPDEYVSVSLSPLRPMGIVHFMKFDESSSTVKTRYMAIDVNGRPGQSINVDGLTRGGQLRWTDDGARPLITSAVRDKTTGKASLKNFVLDLATGKTQEVVGVRAYDELQPKQEDLYIDMTVAEAKTGEKSRSVDVAWLKSRTKSKQMAAMIGSDIDASLSPAGNAILCTHQGIVTIRPLVRLPREAFEKALAAAEKLRAINDAKQCALGLILLASDMDDVLPGSGGDWSSMVEPYIKNSDVVSGFVYTFRGGKMEDIENPASTEIGYKPGPGGRAVAYADGHVKWIPDK